MRWVSFVAEPDVEDALWSTLKGEDKETNVYELDNLKRTHQNRIENNENITALKSFGDSTVKVVVDPSPFSVDQSKSSTSGSATNDTQRTFSSLIPKPNKTTCDANSKYSILNSVASTAEDVVLFGLGIKEEKVRWVSFVAEPDVEDLLWSTL